MCPGGAGGPSGRFEYPLRYPLKVIGHAADDFAAHAVALVERAAAGRVVEPPSVRASGGGRQAPRLQAPSPWSPFRQSGWRDPRRERP